MNNFSGIKHFFSGSPKPYNSFFSFILTIALVLSFLIAPDAMAQSRMAGTKHIARSENTALTVLESVGTLDTERDRALGLDLWAGSDYTALTALLESLPPLTPYGSLNQLLRRALLTTADARQIKNRPYRVTEVTAKSFYLLRVKQLLKMGAFADAAALYIANPLPPAEEEQAQAGIIALFLSDKSAMACLEALALDFKTDAFWKNIHNVCHYFLTRNIKALPKDILAQKDIASPLIKKLIADPHFRYPLAALDDFEQLSLLEKALLVTESRLDYNLALKKDGGRIRPQTAALFLADKNLPAAIRFGLTRAAIEKGLTPLADLTALYRDYGMEEKDFAGPSSASPKGWAELAWLYQKQESSAEEEKAEYLEQAIALAPRYNLTALLPFAPFINDQPPSALPDSLQPKALKILVLADQPLAKAWEEIIPTLQENDSLTLAFMSALAFHDQFSTFSGKNNFSEKSTGSLSQKNQVIQVLHEKLDNSLPIDDYSFASGYEKPSRLTSADDYVMPSRDLLERLGEAIRKKRRGEVVLLSILALRETPPHKINPEVVKEVLVGLNIVGLNEDARSLAKEIALRF